VTQSQAVEFDDDPRFLALVLLPKELPSVNAADQGEDIDDSDDEVDLRTAQLPSALPPVPVAAVQPLVPTAAAMLPRELTTRRNTATDVAWASNAFDSK
jgi:hypothetical protein